MGRRARASSEHYVLVKLREPEVIVDLSAICVRMSGSNPNMLGGYLRPSVGLNPENRQRLAHWASYRKTVADPWILYADFTLTPAQLRLSGFLELLGGAQVVTASDTSVTCRAGGDRTLDFVVCSPSAQATTLEPTPL